MVLIDRLMTGGRDFTTQMRGAICRNWINVFLVFVPVGIAAELTHINPAAVFAINAVAIVPLANFLGHATESAAHRLGDAQGAFLSISFGNAVELIILTTALVKNQIGIVQASLLGSILVNLLLVLGTSFLVGGLRYREQVYNSKATQISACLLSLSVMSLLLPVCHYSVIPYHCGCRLKSTRQHSTHPSNTTAENWRAAKCSRSAAGPVWCSSLSMVFT